MSGYNETGTTRKEQIPNSSRAYCEGMNARIAAHDATNPYTDTVHIKELAAWDAGFAYADAMAGSTIGDPQSCACDLGATIPSAP